MADKLITDRTAGDVQRETAKGFYNASDLNRVEGAVEELARLLRELPGLLTAYGKELGIDWKQSRLGYDPASLELRTRTDWAMQDIPDGSDGERYLENVLAVCKALRVDTRDLPWTLDRLTYAGANGIEASLDRAREASYALKEREKDRLDRTAQAWPMAGEIFTGELME